MRTASLVFSMSTAAGSVGAMQYSLNGAQASANQPFQDAFVSYSIEFSSFPDFAGESVLWPQSNIGDWPTKWPILQETTLTQILFLIIS